MDLQQFGTVEVNRSTANAMMCMDADRPGEVMLHWWGPGREPVAALFSLNKRTEGSIELSISRLYKCNASGGLIAPRLSDEEVKGARNYRGILWLDGEGCAGDFFDETGTKGKISLKAATNYSPVIPTLCKTWEEYKLWVARIRKEYNTFYFRGHGSNSFKLRTSLHRAKMHRLERFCSETLVNFTERAESILDMKINLEDGNDYSMALGLAQHHGLPTPLLDWTTSPYIAAFFAFADAVESSDSRPDISYVRVYALTRDYIDSKRTPVVSIPYHKPYISPLSVSGRKNPRLNAQQGHFLVSNVADLEDFIRSEEVSSGKTFLLAADIPVRDAAEALEDLSFMGASASALFPGLDGVCRAIKHSMLFTRQLREPLEAHPAPPETLMSRYIET